MSVNGITGIGSTDYSLYSEDAAKAAASESKTATVSSDAKQTENTSSTGVVYEKSSETVGSSAKTYKPNTELIAKLKADADERTAQMRTLVERLMTQQGTTFGIANSGDSMWKFLAGGNFTVDATTKAQAQADIAEDGYWGVKQTSDRILDFAKALSGGDPDKIETMKNAFIKGFKEATGAWGKDLPDISQRTYDAVMEKFDAWSKEAKKTDEVKNNDSTAQDTTI